MYRKFFIISVVCLFFFVFFANQTQAVEECDCVANPDACYAGACISCDKGECDCYKCPGNCSEDECPSSLQEQQSEDEETSGLVPCGLLTGSEEEKGICRLCHLFILFKRVVDYIFSIVIFAAMLVITIAGIIYLISTGDSGLINRAKSALKMTLIGFALALAAWLIINYILIIIAAKEEPTYGITKVSVKSWHLFEIECKTTPFLDKYFEKLDTKYSPVNFSTPAESENSGIFNDGNPTSCPVEDKNNICKGYTCQITCSIPAEYNDMINDAAEAYKNIGVTENLVRQIICRESGGNADAHLEEPPGSGRCSCGLMQVNVKGGCAGSACMALRTNPRQAIKEGMQAYNTKYQYAKSKMNKYNYSNVTLHAMTTAYYMCCAGGMDVNNPSNDCNSSNGWPLVPKWGCDINTGGATGMCFVKKHACRTAACANE